VKYIPLFDCDSGDYLSIGGELRELYEFFHNENLGSAPADSHGNNRDLLQRYMFHADLHLGPYFRVFTDFVSGLERGLADLVPASMSMSSMSTKDSPISCCPSQTTAALSRRGSGDRKWNMDRDG
jgi:hypothetical protein